MSRSAPNTDIFIVGVAFYAGRNPVSTCCEGSVGSDGKTLVQELRCKGGTVRYQTTFAVSELEIGRGGRISRLFEHAPAGLPAFAD